MEDDDEFGDLYTDVLPPLMTPSFQSQTQPQPQPPPEKIPKVTSASATSYHGCPIDLNVTSDDEDDGQGNLFRAPNSRFAPQDQNLASTTSSSQPGLHSRPDPRNFDLNEEFGQESGNSEGFVLGESHLQARVLGAAGGNVKLPESARGSSGFMDGEPEIDVLVKKGDDKDDFVVKDEKLADKTKAVDNFSVGEGGDGNRGMDLDTTIPGLSIPGVSGGVESRANANFDDDWDSDSEDDLQIVLNDSHHGPMGMERMGGGGMGGEEDDEDDEDGEPLVIVADNDDPGHQPMIMEEQEWGGEEGGPVVDGEKKELSETGKVNGGGGAVVAAPKIGYSSHGYHHPFHSQFKVSEVAARLGFGALTLLFDENLKCTLTCNCCIVLWIMVILEFINVVVCSDEVECCTGFYSPIMKLIMLWHEFSFCISLLLRNSFIIYEIMFGMLQCTC